MSKFDLEKNGYNKKQVESFLQDNQTTLDNYENRIITLENEIANIQKSQEDYTNKSQNISIALTAAVEKARQIESSSKNVYKLKIQQLELLYNKWEALLGEMLKKYPNVSDVNHVKSVMKEFKQSIKNTLKDDFKIAAFSSQSDNDPIRVLLSRMNEHLSRTPQTTKSATIQRSKLSKDLIKRQTELERIEEKAPIIKPIYENKIKENEKFETLADKFLKDNPDESIYAKKFGANSYPTINDSGFDLKEAVNPKEDLSSIMKAFDFYKEDDE